MGQWIVGAISFQKIFGLCGLKGHKVEIMWDVTLVHGQRTTTECEDRARILKQNSQYWRKLFSVTQVKSVDKNCVHLEIC